MAEPMTKPNAVARTDPPRVGAAGGAAQTHPVLRSLKINPARLTMPADIERTARMWLDPETRSYMAPLPPARRRVAGQVADVYDAYLDIPITAPALAAWLEPLITAVEFVPSADLFAGRVSGVMASESAFPALVLNDTCRAEALRRFDRWPSVKKLVDLLQAEKGRLFDHRRALRALSDPPTSIIPPRRGPPSDEEKENVARIVTGWRKEVGADEPAEAKSAPKPKTLSLELLRASYDAVAGSPKATPTQRRLAGARLEVEDPPGGEDGAGEAKGALPPD